MAETNGTTMQQPVSVQERPKDPRLVMWLGQMAQMTNHFITRLFGSRTGEQFGGRRDLRRTAGYLEEPTIGQLTAYSLRGIGARLVEIFPKESWKERPIIRETGDPGEETAFEQSWNELVNAHDVFGYFQELDILANVGEFAVLFISTDGVTDFRRPLRQQARGGGQTVGGPSRIRYLRCYSQEDVDIIGFNDNPADPEYGRPTMYRLTTRIQSFAGGGTGLNHSFDVHASHIIHFANLTREDRVYGQPMLKRGIDAIFDSDKIMAGIAEMIWQDGKRRLIMTTRDAASTAQALADKTGLNENIEKFMHDQKNFVLLGNVDTEAYGGVVPNIAENYTKLQQLLAGIYDIPMRILFGSEQGSLATEEDIKKYKSDVVARIAYILIPRVVRAFIDKAIEIGAVAAPAGDPRSYEVMPPNLLELSPLQRSEVDRNNTQNIKDLSDVIMAGTGIITAEEGREHAVSTWELDPVLPLELEEQIDIATLPTELPESGEPTPEEDDEVTPEDDEGDVEDAA